MTYHEHRKLWQHIPAYILITDFCLYDFISFFFSFFLGVISFFSFKPWSWFLDDVNQLKVTCQLENDTCTSRDMVFIIDEAAATAITTPSISQTDETQQFNEDVSCVLQSYYVYRHQEKKNPTFDKRRKVHWLFKLWSVSMWTWNVESFEIDLISWVGDWLDALVI